MKTKHRSFASISVLELAAGAASLVLCAVTLTAFAQTPTATPPTAVGASGKPIVAVEQPKVLADPETRIYSRCTTGDEARDPGAAPYKPNAKAQVMTEEAAKAKGFKAGAHKVTFDQRAGSELRGKAATPRCGDEMSADDRAVGVERQNRIGIIVAEPPDPTLQIVVRLVILFGVKADQPSRQGPQRDCAHVELPLQT
jgi:hypothetical protein